MTTTLKDFKKEPTLIECSNVSISMSHGKKILNNISFSIHKNEIVTLIGPNGSGKTTLAKLFCGLIKPNEGGVSRKDNLVIGYIPQKISVDRVMPLTVRRFLRLNGSSLKLRKLQDIESVAEKMSITHLLKSQIHDISGGEMQRVMLARTLLLRPEVIIMDEPTQGLDIQSQEEFYKIIANIRDELGCGIFLISHDLHMVMAATDRVICLNGHICCQGTPEDVNNNPEYLKLFGKSLPKAVAIYTHEHDHSHNHEGCASKEHKHD